MSESIDVLNELLEYSKGMLTAEKYGLQHKILSMIKEQEHEQAHQKEKAQTMD